MQICCWCSSGVWDSVLVQFWSAGSALLLLDLFKTTWRAQILMKASFTVLAPTFSLCCFELTVFLSLSLSWWLPLPPRAWLYIPCWQDLCLVAEPLRFSSQLWKMRALATGPVALWSRLQAADDIWFSSCSYPCNLAVGFMTAKTQKHVGLVAAAAHI